MGRSAILSKSIATVKVITTEKFVSYVIPIDERLGSFHSVETVNGNAVVKFFPTGDPKTVFRIYSGGEVNFK